MRGKIDKLNECHKCGLNILYFCKRKLLQNFCNYYEIKVFKLDCQVIMYELAS